ncbi:hypothetical protein D3C74_184670 [compost metagenome]
MSSQNSGSVEFSEAHAVFDIVVARLASSGFPINPFSEPVVSVLNRHGLQSCESVGASTLPQRVSTFFFLESSYFAKIGGSGLRAFDLNAAAAGDRFNHLTNLYVVNGQNNSNIESFVVTPVGEGINSWLLPVAFPMDVARIALTRFGSARNLQRFFAYFAGLYCDALAVLGDDVGIRTELIRSISLLASFLGMLIGSLAGTDSPDGRAECNEEREGGDQ